MRSDRSRQLQSALRLFQDQVLKKDDEGKSTKESEIRTYCRSHRVSEP